MSLLSAVIGGNVATLVPLCLLYPLLVVLLMVVVGGCNKKQPRNQPTDHYTEMSTHTARTKSAYDTQTTDANSNTTDNNLAASDGGSKDDDKNVANSVKNTKEQEQEQLPTDSVEPSSVSDKSSSLLEQSKTERSRSGDIQVPYQRDKRHPVKGALKKPQADNKKPQPRKIRFRDFNSEAKSKSTKV